MNPDEKKSQYALPTASALDAPPQMEPRGGPDAEQLRQAKIAAAALAEPLPTVEEQERSKRLRAKVDLYRWMRAQRPNQLLRGGLEGAVVGTGWQLFRAFVIGGRK